MSQNHYPSPSVQTEVGTTGRHQSSRQDGDSLSARSAALSQIYVALVRLNLETRRRDTAEVDLEAQMAAYAERLLPYRMATVLEVLERWPSKSEFWPTWKELRDELGEPASAVRALEPPRVAPEHRLLNQSEAQRAIERAQLHRRLTDAEWAGFQDALAKVRDPNVPMVAKGALLRIGEAIERRQLAMRGAQ